MAGLSWRGASVSIAIISDWPHHEQSQMITNAKGRPIPIAPPITMAIAKSKPANACHDMVAAPFVEPSLRKHDRSVAIEAGQIRMGEAG
jgi:hypothetical protein